MIDGFDSRPNFVSILLVFDTIGDMVGDGGCDHIHGPRFFSFPSLGGRLAIDVSLRDDSTSEIVRLRLTPTIKMPDHMHVITVSDPSLTMVMQSSLMHLMVKEDELSSERRSGRAL